jgi:hypothetical protein
MTRFPATLFGQQQSLLSSPKLLAMNAKSRPSTVPSPLMSAFPPVASHEVFAPP